MPSQFTHKQEEYFPFTIYHSVYVQSRVEHSIGALGLRILFAITWFCFFELSPKLIPWFVAVYSWLGFGLRTINWMSALSGVICIWWCVIVTAMEFFNSLIPFFWNSVWSLFPLVIIQTGLPYFHYCSLTWCSHSSRLIFAKGVHSIVFPWLEGDDNWLFGFTSQFYKNISARYHLSCNNVSSKLEVLIISCSILQTTCSIIYLLVDAKQFSRWITRATIILWENKQIH